MSAASAARTGGQILVDGLVAQGVDHAFAVAGESYLEVLDALYDERDALRLVTCRQEGGAAFMAEAYGKLTGRPGVALVTRGPGACNAAIGVHTARQDSTPMLLLVGQVGQGHVDREAFQEVDFRRMFAPLAKWAAQIDRADRIPEYLSHAFHVAVNGRPGPVVLALPEDMLRECAAVADAELAVAFHAAPPPAALTRFADLIATAERPLAIVGGSGWDERAIADFQAFAERADLPVACSFRRQDLFDNAHPCYVGELSTGPNPPLLQRVRDADLLIVVGARLGEIATQGYTLLEAPEPRQPLIHVHLDPDELGRVFRPTLGIPSGMASFAAAAARLEMAPRRRAWREEARAEYEASLKPMPYDGALDLGRAMLQLAEALPADTVVTIDAGNFSGWPQRFFRFRRPMRELGPTSGAMGYSVPAGVAASILNPGRCVVSFVGDGGFLMTGQEIATARQHGAAPIVIVVNNGMYGTIRMHQEKRFPGRVSGTDLQNPDFVKLAEAYGAFAARVTRTDELVPAFAAARRAARPAVIELVADPEVITTRTTISALRRSALARA